MSYEKMTYEQKKEASNEFTRGVVRIFAMSGEDENGALTMCSAYWSSATAYDIVDEVLWFLRDNPNATREQLRVFFDKEVESAKARKKEESMKKLKKGLIIAAVAVVAILILSVIL